MLKPPDDESKEEELPLFPRQREVPEFPQQWPMGLIFVSLFLVMGCIFTALFLRSKLPLWGIAAAMAGVGAGLYFFRHRKCPDCGNKLEWVEEPLRGKPERVWLLVRCPVCRSEWRSGLIRTKEQSTTSD